MTASFKPAPGFKKDYAVPNFGADNEIITSQTNLKEAEKKAGHSMSTAQAAPIP